MRLGTSFRVPYSNVHLFWKSKFKSCVRVTQSGSKTKSTAKLLAASPWAQTPPEIQSKTFQHDASKFDVAKSGVAHLLLLSTSFQSLAPKRCQYKASIKCKKKKARFAAGIKGQSSQPKRKEKSRRRGSIGSCAMPAVIFSAQGRSAQKQHAAVFSA